MVLAVNPPLTGQTAASFQEAAKTATINRPAPPSSSSSEPSRTSTGSGSGSTGGSGSGSGSGSGGGVMTNGINSVLAFGAFFLALM